MSIFEWDFEDGGQTKTLVVEVDFDTDPNSTEFRPPAPNEIEQIAKDTLTHKTTMVISRLRVVPKKA